MSNDHAHDDAHNHTNNAPPLIVTLVLPSAFVALCHSDQVQPGTVLQGFIADLCALRQAEAGYLSQGMLPHMLASWYYAGVGCARWPRLKSK